MTFLIAIVLIAMLALFFAVTIAGGKAHDRQNAETARKAELRADETRPGGQEPGKGK